MQLTGVDFVKILFNCVVNSKGGAVQNAANFISIARRDEEHVFQFIVSRAVYAVLKGWGENDELVHVVDHPLTGKNSRKLVSEIERDFGPDVVYTMAGPSYLKFCNMHVLGISDAYTTHAKVADFFYGRSIIGGLKHLFKSFLKGILARTEGDFFIFQTETARAGFCGRYHVKNYTTRVVSNSLGKSFLNSYPDRPQLPDYEVDDIRLLCPAADYPHKDLFIIKRIAALVAASSERFEFRRLVFYVTVDSASGFAKEIPAINRLTNRVFVVNKGPFSYTQALDVYNDSDIVFMPSVLETFSTSYLEALASGKILLTADKPFSREICSEAAYYFTPKDELSALEAIQRIFLHKPCPDSLRAREVLVKYGDYYRRYSSLMKAISSFQKLSRGVNHV